MFKTLEENHVVNVVEQASANFFNGLMATSAKSNQRVGGIIPGFVTLAVIFVMDLKLTLLISAVPAGKLITFQNFQPEFLPARVTKFF
jgi:hypothetical protein